MTILCNSPLPADSSTDELQTKEAASPAGILTNGRRQTGQSVWQVESAYFGGQNVHRLTAAPEVESSYPSGLGRRVEGLLLRAHPVRFSRCV